MYKASYISVQERKQTPQNSNKTIKTCPIAKNNRYKIQGTPSATSPTHSVQKRKHKANIKNKEFHQGYMVQYTIYHLHDDISYPPILNIEWLTTTSTKQTQQ